ncbi:DUF3089 domain-containing protein [Streptomyces sp. RPT161]|uniref:DUF3089 domain-containing protein n=1 Tax=Streptomyces sp. RPT161 TaxID=3015993 RepID=UPI0022B8C1A6|nr:DUF3089 domain-containing protein [Streptomyces sp. RPT161]
MRRHSRLSLTLLSLALLSGTSATAAAAPAAAPNRSPSSTSWLCRPGLADNPCDQDVRGNPQRPSAAGSFTMRYGTGRTVPLDARQAPSGREEAFRNPDRPAVDCFYAYPTVDMLGANAWRAPEEQVMAVLLAQVARFSGGCRMFAPVYRQATFAEILSSGKSAALARGETDVENAWRDYWNHDNIDPVTHRHRGVVILGHSQGATALKAMMRREIDPNPTARAHLVSAFLLGGDVTTTTFRHIPACERTGSSAPMPTGCVVAYSSYAQPPAAKDMFGHTGSPDDHVLCVDPAALLDGRPNGRRHPLDAYMPTGRSLDGNPLSPKGSLGIVLTGFRIPDAAAGYVHYPHALNGRCELRRNAHGTTSWLQVSGDTASFTEPGTRSLLSGLHVIDFNVAQGDLVRLAAEQSRTWTAHHH